MPKVTITVDDTLVPALTGVRHLPVPTSHLSNPSFRSCCLHLFTLHVVQCPISLRLPLRRGAAAADPSYWKRCGGGWSGSTAKEGTFSAIASTRGANFQTYKCRSKSKALENIEHKHRRSRPHRLRQDLVVQSLEHDRLNRWLRQEPTIERARHHTRSRLLGVHHYDTNMVPREARKAARTIRVPAVHAGRLSRSRQSHEDDHRWCKHY